MVAGRACRFVGAPIAAAATRCVRLHVRLQMPRSSSCPATGKALFPGPFSERTTGIEPATLSLGS
jgi:hypothetical protein